MFAAFIGAATQLLEGLLVVAEIFVFLGEGIADLHLAAPIGDGLRGQRCELRHMISRRRLDPQLGAVEVGLVIQRLQRDDLVVVSLGPLEIPDKPAHRCPVVAEPRIVRRERHGSVVGRERTRLLVGATAQRADCIQNGGIGRRAALRSIRGIECLPPPVQRHQAGGAMQAERRVLGLQCHRLIDGVECRCGGALRHGNVTGSEPGAGELRKLGVQVSTGRIGAAPVPGLHEPQHFPVRDRRGLFRRHGQRRSVRVRRRGTVAAAMPGM